MEKNSNNKAIAIVLGGTFPHITLIKKLQKRGFYTILVDFYENPIAKKAADEHIRESTLDQEKVLEIAKNWGASLVISTCVDQANVIACYVAEKLNLPAPYSYETALAVSNKGLMKEKMVQAGIPTAKHVYVRDIKNFDSLEIDFPVIVKPADSNSSKGVRKAEDHAELSRFFEDAIRISRNDMAIVEEYIEGREVGIDCFVKNNESTILMTKERQKINIDDEPTQQIIGCLWPVELSKQNKSDLKKITNQIAKAFNLNNTPLMIQAIINGDDISIIEFGARIGGGESFRLIELSTGFDIVDAAIDSFLGNEVTLNYHESEMYYADNFIYCRPGFFGHISGPDFLKENCTIEYLDQFRTHGMEIGAELSSNNRCGVFVVKSNNMDELFNKINTAIENIEVYDIDGNPIMRKDIYSQ